MSFFFSPGGSHSSVFFCLQEVHSQLCSQKAQFQRLMERLKMKHSDMRTPSEIEGQLQEVTQSLQQLEQKVACWYRPDPGLVPDLNLGAWVGH